MGVKEFDVEQTDIPVIYLVSIPGAILYRHSQKDKLIIEVKGHVVGEVSRLAVASGLVDLDEMGHYIESPSNVIPEV